MLVVDCWKEWLAVRKARADIEGRQRPSSACQLVVEECA
jgi:hypothetical protein